MPSDPKSVWWMATSDWYVGSMFFGVWFFTCLLSEGWLNSCDILVYWEESLYTSFLMKDISHVTFTLTGTNAMDFNCTFIICRSIINCDTKIFLTVRVDGRINSLSLKSTQCWTSIFSHKRILFDRLILSDLQSKRYRQSFNFKKPFDCSAWPSKDNCFRVLNSLLIYFVCLRAN